MSATSRQAKSTVKTMKELGYTCDNGVWTSSPEAVAHLASVADKMHALLVQSITPRAVDKIYAAVQEGPRGKRVRQANISINVARRAWDVVRRLYPKTVPIDNPFKGVLKEGGTKAKPAAARAEAYALAQALKSIGEAHLGAAALIVLSGCSAPRT